jgi:hypothetical protein
LVAALNEVTAADFIDICDYRLIPERETDYSVNMVTQALRSFQDMVTSIYDAITTRPKVRGSWDAASVANSSFSFGYSYSGSLGIVLVIPNERLIGDIESNLDRSVMAALEATKTRDTEAVAQFARDYPFVTFISGLKFMPTMQSVRELNGGGKNLSAMKHSNNFRSSGSFVIWLSEEANL